LAQGEKYREAERVIELKGFLKWNLGGAVVGKKVPMYDGSA
jgi:hypothetical protein